MKRSKTQLLRNFAAVMLLGAGLVSCSQDDIPQADGTPLPYGQYPLTLTASVDGMNTRTAGKDYWADNDQIGVRIGTDGATGCYSLYSGGAVKETVTPVYWQSTASATVTAWHPYEAKNNVDISNQSGGFADFDFLTATETEQHYKSPVSLKFKHRMAKVKYKLLQGEGITEGDLATATVSIAGYTEASFAAGELTGDKDGWITPTTADGEALLVPQDMTDKQFIKVTVGMTGGDKRDFYYIPTGNAGLLQAGYVYTYTITVKLTGLSVEPSVSWNDGGPITGEGTPAPLEYYYLTLPEGLGSVEVKDAEGTPLNPGEDGRYALPATHNRFSITYPRSDVQKSLVPVSGLCKVKTRTGTEAEQTYTSEYDNVFSDVTLSMEEYAHPGDYYYSDGTWAPYLKTKEGVTAIGVVFHSGVGLGDDIANYASTSLTKIHGYAVAAKDMLNKTLSGWGGKLPRNEEGELQDCDIPEITNYDLISYNGFVATRIIREQYMPHTNQYEFPAFAALDTYDKEVAPAPETSSGWYMPSVAMCGAIDAVKETIKFCPDGTEPSGAYLTTCENDAAGVTGYRFNGDRSENTGRDKNDYNSYIRAVLTF